VLETAPPEPARSRFAARNREKIQRSVTLCESVTSQTQTSERSKRLRLTLERARWTGPHDHGHDREERAGVQTTPDDLRFTVSE
jgi:hypothetical protein